jgi:S1-C subfamily serine protease
MKPTVLRALSLAAGLALAAGTGAATYAAIAPASYPTSGRQVTVTGASEAAASSAPSVAGVYEQAHASVVEVTVTSAGSSGLPFGPDSGAQRAQGSGFVYDDDGHIVTNQHVVAGAENISVLFSNGERYDATLVGSDASTDLAVLKVDAPASVPKPLELADSSKLEVGEGVVAIGSPFGLEDTVTAGIVSALHRQMEALNGFTINDSIQTDAAINHGNSGGPLLDLKGRVVGVTAQIASESGGNDGVGFAIPSNTVRSVVSQLVSGGSVEHAYLGVALTEIPSSVADELGVAAGVAVMEVRDGTPAAEAGLRAASGSTTVDGQQYPTGGDVITAVDGETVATPAELQRAIDAKRPGDTVSLTYVREGESRTVRVELARRPA